MPTLSVKRDALFQRLEKTFTDAEFDELCFQFGIELDEVTSEREQVTREQGEQAGANLSDDVIYKIELPANRYDLLSLEGLTRALRCYLGMSVNLDFKVTKPVTKIIVGPSVASVRPYVVGAVLRNISFTQASYEAFIELQDKLHNGIGRKRTIVSMGTHDLDTISGPFRYEALSPSAIRFAPLNQKTEMDGNELMQFYQNDLKLKKYLHIIKDSPVYPVILDSAGTVCSLPPIINSDHSKISLNTKNVFIEVTGTDKGKLMTALNVIATAFMEYCAVKEIEAVEIVYPDHTEVTPDLSARLESVSVDYINRSIGLELSAQEIVLNLKKMMLASELGEEGKISVSVPAIRSDILHACDIMEDVAIAHGFNNIPRTIPGTNCAGAPFALNKLSDGIRREVALSGFTEVLTLTLCSRREQFDHLRQPDTGNAVILSNPATAEYQLVHVNLVPAMLKTVSANRHQPVPLKIFQIADVVLLDAASETGARNERHLAAVYCNTSTSGFEMIHGLLDRVMAMLNVKPGEYFIEPSAIEYYFDGRQAEVVYKGTKIGSFGVVHPQVLSNYDISDPCSLLELNIEPFL